jgi:hypothetical protein
VPITPPIGEGPLTYTVLDLISDALIETGIQSPGDTIDSDTAQWAFRKVNYLLDTWATKKNYVYAQNLAIYTLVPNLSPHLIGPAPGATFVVPQRPVKIVRATVILNNTPQPFVSIPLTLRDEEWWMGNTIQQLTSSQPTDLYYNPTFPNGSLFYWPIPTTAYQTQLETWSLLSQFASITDPIGGPNTTIGTIPPGYRNALMLSLAESLLSGAQLAANPELKLQAAAARAGVFGLNNTPPRMNTRDSGIPGADNDLRSTTFNYRSRSW